MRPTITEQLSGADRLLALAETEETIDAAAELISNARRLVKWVSDSWDRTLPFIQSDSVELAQLLGGEHAPAPASSDPTGATDLHDSLLAALSEEIRAWDEDDSAPLQTRRAQVGAYLVRRVAANPT